MPHLLPISAIVPTRNRASSLENLLRSLSFQSKQPLEMIVIDASLDNLTKSLCLSKNVPGLETRIEYVLANETGAAVQRNQGVKLSTQQTILFVDDDIVFETDCIARLWTSLQTNHQLGGVSSMITNQRYQPPGLVSRFFFRAFNGRTERSYAGKCIGPALNILPEDSTDLPDTVPVEWLNTTCTIYRREALPSPPFDPHFNGYSFMEDVALSLTVGRKWKLANARTARIYHDSQSGEHKQNRISLAKMQLVNRHYVMTEVLGKRRVSDYALLTLLQVFELVSSFTSKSGIISMPANLVGRLAGALAICLNENTRRTAE